MRQVLLALSIAVVLFVSASTPVYAQANLPLLNPDFAIVPEVCQACPCGYAGVLQLIQNLINAGIAVGVIAFIIVVVYAGATFMMNPTNPESRSKARSMFLNVVVGMVIVLAAWLVVDFIMKMLYDSSHEAQGVEFGPWNEILAPEIAGSSCIEPTAVTPMTGLFGGISTGILGGDQTYGGGSGGGGGGGGAVAGNPANAPGVTGSGACNAQRLTTTAAGIGITLSSREANTFACLASPESSCGTRLQNYAWNRGSSAFGAFQVLLDSNARFYENATCRRAAGLAENQRLNCAAGFRGGNPIPGSAIATRCVNAASNMACSLAAAVALERASGFNNWTSDRNHAVQNACIARYAN